MTVAIEMGHTTAGAPATLDLEELLATRLLVQGNSGSGKSHLLRRLLEQSAPWVQQTIIDPEGDFVTLADRFGHLLIDAEDHTERGLQVAGERARIHRVSTVLNLEGLDAENQMRRAAAFLGGLFDVGRDVLGEFRQSLGGDDPRKPAFAATAHQVRRGAEREFARLVQNLAGDCRCEELRLIQHQQYRVPVSRCCFYARPNTGGEVRRFMRRIDFRSRLVGGKITLQP